MKSGCQPRGSRQQTVSQVSLGPMVRSTPAVRAERQAVAGLPLPGQFLLSKINRDGAK